MKIKISKILLVLSVCGLLYSCDKFFEVDLKGQMDEEKVVNNEDYLAKLWAGLYWAMENGFTAVGNGGYASACDEADNNQQSSSVQKFNTGSWNAQSNPDDLYARFYQAIRSANDFLRLSDTVNNPQYTFREYEKGEPEKYATKVFNWHAYRLDASFLKAYYHFELWKRYGDIAIADKLLTESEALALERTPGQEVVEYIVRTLDSLAPMYDALETMKNTQYTNGKWIDNQYGRITKGAVLALKARVLLYAASTTYHTVDSTDKVNRRLRKLDHMMIFVLIAGSYTPICLITLRGPQGTALCAAVWAVALAGIAIKALWITCPKWFSSVLYIAMGWLCVFAVVPIVNALSPAGFGWLLAGGIIYTAGGVLYALKLPLFNARHKVFGTHEIFHVFVMAGSVCHYVLMYFFVMPALA